MVSEVDGDFDCRTAIGAALAKTIEFLGQLNSAPLDRRAMADDALMTMQTKSPRGSQYASYSK